MAASSIPLHTLPVTLQPTRRLTQLMLGLALYGVSLGLMFRANLGLDPWDVFHQGLSHLVPLSFGMVINLTGVVVLLAWIPLRQRPGIGTVANVVMIGTCTDLTLSVLPPLSALWLRILVAVAAVVLNALATASYIGARLGPGPRDGLMTGFAARTGLSIRLVRTVIELTVLAAGWLLGGSVGPGTVLYAVTIGPLAQLFLPFVALRTPCEWKTRH